MVLGHEGRDFDRYGKSVSAYPTHTGPDYLQ